MALNEMQVFDKYVVEATIETLDQMVDKFNAASAGTIVLTTQGFEGDFIHEQMWKSIHAAQRRVDRYTTNAAASPTDMEELRETGVKVAGGFGPIRWEPSQLSWMLRNPAEAVEAASRNMAEAIMSDQLNSAISAAVGAFENNSPVKKDVSGSADVTYAGLNSAHALFGDHSGNIVANVMNGATYHALIGQNLTNTPTLFQAQNVTVVDILGKAVVVTDAPALHTDLVPSPSAPAKDRVLGLVPGALTVYDGSDLITNIEIANGKERIETTFQADYSFGLAMRGYSWDGGKSPDNADIGTGSNWVQIATSDKHTAGVILIGQAAA